MLSERERAIKNVLMGYLGSAAGAAGSGEVVNDVDTIHLQMAQRRMSVNRRRMVIFVVLYALVVVTAVAVMTLTAKNFSELIWVGAGTFNAVNAAIHYAEYQRKKMAFAVLEVLEQNQE